jgi:hypothetical protein
MEWWSIGSNPITPTLQYSITPFPQSSHEQPLTAPQFMHL